MLHHLGNARRAPERLLELCASLHHALVERELDRRDRVRRRGGQMLLLVVVDENAEHVELAGLAGSLDDLTIAGSQRADAGERRPVVVLGQDDVDVHLLSTVWASTSSYSSCD